MTRGERTFLDLTERKSPLKKKATRVSYRISTMKSIRRHQYRGVRKKIFTYLLPEKRGKGSADDYKEGTQSGKEKDRHVPKPAAEGKVIPYINRGEEGFSSASTLKHDHS